MKIAQVKINHYENPLGYDLENLRVSYKICDALGKKQKQARILVSINPDMSDPVYDSGISEDIDSLGFSLPIDLIPRTRYHVQVESWSDANEYAKSEIFWFETAKLNEVWAAKWIGSPLGKNTPPVFAKEFETFGECQKARIYSTGLGMYEIYIDGQKVGDEYFAPGCTNYEDRIQYQTYDATLYLKNSGVHKIEAYLADGWYKGRFGLRGRENNYGDDYAFLAEIHIFDKSGNETVIGTDETWLARKSEITFSSIYDGEIYEPEIKNSPKFENAVLKDIGFELLMPRNCEPVCIHQKFSPVQIIKTPAGETVLDFGQNMSGFVRFACKIPKGEKLTLQYGEILQNGNFYRDNLRSAKAEYTYISDGNEHEISPHFTYYGFRYAKITGISNEEILKKFEAAALYSDIKRVGSIKTSNEKVNRLIQNSEWGQRSNFVDVPTDCPQRDERMGWTADTQVYCKTALFQTDAYNFYRKYLKDMASEQKHTGGAVPHVIPAFEMRDDSCSVWGDAATIIPWSLYLFYGDIQILSEQYESMKAWVDYIYSIDEQTGGKRLWSTGFHFGDWLGLDSETGTDVKGGTDDTYIASAYYFNSAQILAKSAALLGKSGDAQKYGKLSDEILAAIRKEYFTSTGRLAVNTQTGYVLALAFGLCPDFAKERIAADLAQKLKLNKVYLKTGFVGTVYICKVLSDNGYNDLAYRLLLNEDCPSWLYAVNMGATTIWERWNSVLPDGKISDTGMNSLNHYAYGSVVEWMYRSIAGLNPTEKSPGFKEAIIAPKPDCRIKEAEMSYDSPMGIYKICWKIEDDGLFKLKIEIPFGARAELILPNAQKEPEILASGVYEYSYLPSPPLIKTYGISSPINELLQKKECIDILSYFGIDANAIPAALADSTIVEIKHMPFISITDEKLKELDFELNRIK
jgi:alpha-L-rhamnosidase